MLPSVGGFQGPTFAPKSHLDSKQTSPIWNLPTVGTLTSHTPLMPWLPIAHRVFWSIFFMNWASALQACLVAPNTSSFRNLVHMLGTVWLLRDEMDGSPQTDYKYVISFSKFLVMCYKSWRVYVGSGSGQWEYTIFGEFGIFPMSSEERLILIHILAQSSDPSSTGRSWRGCWFE